MSILKLANLKLAVDKMPDMHEFSANHTRGVPVLGGSNQVHESKILLANIGKIKKSLNIHILSYRA